MPANIGRYGWTVPEGTDAPAGPEQFTELALDIATTLGGVDDRLLAVETPPFVLCRRTAAQTIPSGSAPVPIQFNLKDEDASGMSSVNGDVFTIKKAGVWQVMACVVFAANVTGPRWVAVCLNGSAYTNVRFASGAMALSTAGWNHPLTTGGAVRLAVNETVIIGAVHAAGVDVTTSTAYPSSLSMVWRRP